MKVDPWYASKRYWLAALLVVSTAVKNLGFEISPELQNLLSDNLTSAGTSIAMIIGAATAIWSKQGEKKKIAEAKAVETIKK